MATSFNNIDMVASAAITAGQLVEVTGSGTVGPAGAASTKVVGVAFTDAANGDRVAVAADGAHEMISVGAIVAGAKVITGAAGTVSTIGAGTFDQKVGVALTTASGNLVRILLTV